MSQTSQTKANPHMRHHYLFSFQLYGNVAGNDGKGRWPHGKINMRRPHIDRDAIRKLGQLIL